MRKAKTTHLPLEEGKVYMTRFQAHEPFLLTKIIYNSNLEIIYRLQKNDIEVTPEIPTTVGEFQVTEYAKGKTLNFKLFLTEEELAFLADEGESLLIVGVRMLEYCDSIEHISHLKNLRVKGILQNYSNSEDEEIFVGTELGKYLWESFLKLEK